MENQKTPKLGNGKICYLEIPADDVEKSANFYHQVFGWNSRLRGDGNTAFNDGVGEVSGAWITGRPASNQAGLLVSIMVDSVADTIKKITEAGGTIVSEVIMDSGEVMAWFLDIFGNLMGLYQHPGGGAGKICYVEIPAANVSHSAEFYNAIFEWPTSDQGNVIGFEDSVGVVSGMWITGRPASTEPGLLIYVMVDNIHTAIDLVTAAGGVIVQPVGADAPEITARFKDPFGNVLGLYQERQ